MGYFIHSRAVCFTLIDFAIFTENALYVEGGGGGGGQVKLYGYFHVFLSFLFRFGFTRE